MDITEQLKEISFIHHKQLPFVVAASLTDTAKDAQRAVKKQMPRKFELHNQKFLPGGVRITPAKKTQSQPTAVVFHKDDWMGRQEEGQNKTPQGSHLGIPTSTMSMEGRATSGKYKKSSRPKSLLKAKGATNPKFAGKKGGRGILGNGKMKPFLMTTKAKKKLIVRRSSRGAKRMDFEVLYHFTKVARVKPRWDFEKTVVGVVKNRFHRNFARRFNNAIR